MVRRGVPSRRGFFFDRGLLAMGFWRSGREDFVNRRRSPSRDHLLLVTARVNGAQQERMRKAGALAVVLAALAGAVWAGAMGSTALAAWLFQKNQRFDIKQLDLHSSGRLSPAHLRHYAGLSEGQNLFAVDIAALRAKLAGVPLISQVEVQRRLPDTLVVRVQERVALAQIPQTGMPALPVDREGHVMSPPAPSHLPRIAGVSERGLAPGGVLRQAAAREALTLLDIHDNARLADAVPIATVDVSDPTQFVLTLRNGGRVMMGRDHMERRLNRLLEMLRYGEERDEDLVTADLTGDRNETATFKPRTAGGTDAGRNGIARHPHG